LPTIWYVLSILIGTSQLLSLPLLIYLVVKRHYALVPVACCFPQLRYFLCGYDKQRDPSGVA